MIVFSRCADSVQNGRRLENLSWRIWQREQLVESKTRAAAAHLTSHTTSLPQNIYSEARLPEVPQLSGSVESVADDEAVEFTSVSAPLDIARPHILRQDSSSRRDRQHISSDDFEKMILSIVKDKAPLSAPTQTSPISRTQKPVVFSPPSIQRSGSTTTESQSPSKDSDMTPSEADSQPSPEMGPRTATTVVRGFSPSKSPMPLSISQRSTKLDPIPEPTSSPVAKHVQSKKAPTTFQLGASCSSSEQGRSLETRQPVMLKKSAFQIGVSSEEEGSLKSAILSHRSRLSDQKKQTSFSNHVSTRTIESADNAIDSDSEGDYVDESAIDDDDDSSDWEDSLEDSGKSSMDDRFFQRVDSKVNLTSRRSLITLGLAKNERAQKLGGHASQSTSAIHRSRGQAPGSAAAGSPNDSDEAPLMMRGARPSRLGPIREIPRSSAQPIAAPPSHAHAQAALSPRTTRRNMLADELTESLRRHMIWERKQKSSTANAVLKRRHTSHDVANLQQYPEQACIKADENEDAAKWDSYFAKEQYNGYHSKGW